MTTITTSAPDARFSTFTPPPPEEGSSSFYDYINAVPNSYHYSMQWVLDKKSAINALVMSLPRHYENFKNSEFASALNDIGLNTRFFSDISSIGGGYYLSKGKFIPAGLSVVSAYAMADSLEDLNRTNGIVLTSFAASMLAKKVYNAFNKQENKTEDKDPLSRTLEQGHGDKTRRPDRRSGLQSPRRVGSTTSPKKLLPPDDDLIPTQDKSDPSKKSVPRKLSFTEELENTISKRQPKAKSSSSQEDQDVAKASTSAEEGKRIDSQAAGNLW